MVTWKDTCALTPRRPHQSQATYLQSILCKGEINLNLVQGIVFSALVCSGRLNPSWWKRPGHFFHTCPWGHLFPTLRPAIHVTVVLLGACSCLSSTLDWSREAPKIWWRPLCPASSVSLLLISKLHVSAVLLCWEVCSLGLECSPSAQWLETFKLECSTPALRSSVISPSRAN